MTTDEKLKALRSEVDRVDRVRGALAKHAAVALRGDWEALDRMEKEAEGSLRNFEAALKEAQTQADDTGQCAYVSVVPHAYKPYQPREYRVTKQEALTPVGAHLAEFEVKPKQKGT